MTDLPDINTVGVFATDKETFLQTASGALISVQNPDPGLIDFGDIVHSLSKQCRFNGHCKAFYSVAEHTLRGTRLIMELEPENTRLARSFFLHDFTEAYVGDIIRPIKKHLLTFQEMEKVFHKVICEAFNFPPEDFDEEGVFRYDNYMVMWEKRDLLPNSLIWPGMPSIAHLNLETLQPLPEGLVVKGLWKLRQELFGGRYV